MVSEHITTLKIPTIPNVGKQTKGFVISQRKRHKRLCICSYRWAIISNTTFFLQKLRAYSREPLLLYPLRLLFITCKTKSVLRKSLRIEISQTQITLTHPTKYKRKQSPKFSCTISHKQKRIVLSWWCCSTSFAFPSSLSNAAAAKSPQKECEQAFYIST